jgi:hypothetical protein
VGVVTQYVTAQVTGTDAQGRVTTGQTVEQVILTVTNTASVGAGEPEVVTLTATNAQAQATGGVVVVTMTESSTSTEPDGNQVIIVKTITSSVRYTRPAGTATMGSQGSLQTGSSAQSIPRLSLPLMTTIIGVISALLIFGASAI